MSDEQTRDFFQITFYGIELFELDPNEFFNFTETPLNLGRFD